MTIFDQLSFEQRAYAIQQLETLVATLKECNFRDRLAEMGQLFSIGGATTQDIEQEILTFALNHFGQPYSHEARESE